MKNKIEHEEKNISEFMIEVNNAEQFGGNEEVSGQRQLLDEEQSDNVFS